MISTFVDFIFSTAGVVIMLCVSAMIGVAKPRFSAVRYAFASLACAYLLASTYAVPYLVSRLLVHGFHQFSSSDALPGKTAVVVLGARGQYVRGWNGEQITASSRVAAARV